MQLATLIEGVVRAVGPQTQLEAQVGVVAQVLGDARDVLAGDEDAELAAVDGDFLNDVGNLRPSAAMSSSRTSTTWSNQPP